jgi:CRISPR-associated exonuclease Cas4
MFPEDDLLPISALQHLLYCPRQCALIHLERLWAENRLTVEGKQLHQRADAGRPESRGEVRVARSLPLRSLSLGLFGVADVVEFHPPQNPPQAPPDRTARFIEPLTPANPAIAFPVEYKRGKPKPHDADRVQLCAQALCLEEMLQTPVPAGALFYGKTRRRLPVAFDAPLRSLTLQTIELLHAMIASRRTPAAVYEKRKCERCSLINLCLPQATSGSRSAAGYLSRSLAQLSTATFAPTDD